MRTSPKASSSPNSTAIVAGEVQGSFNESLLHRWRRRFRHRAAFFSSILTLAIVWALWTGRTTTVQKIAFKVPALAAKDRPAPLDLASVAAPLWYAPPPPPPKPPPTTPPTQIAAKPPPPPLKLQIIGILVVNAAPADLPVSHAANEDVFKAILYDPDRDVVSTVSVGALVGDYLVAKIDVNGVDLKNADLIRRLTLPRPPSTGIMVPALQSQTGGVQ